MAFLERFGSRCRGRLPGVAEFGGVPHDHALYGLILDEARLG